MILKGRALKDGQVTGQVLKTLQPISFFGGIDPKTSEIIDKSHELFGRQIKGTIFVYPHSIGSTVGSYIFYQLYKNGVAPLAYVLEEATTIDATGIIISQIPAADKIDISKIPPFSKVSLIASGKKALLLLLEF